LNIVLLEEVELPYNIEMFERRPDKLAPDELKKIHPLGISPVTKDGDKIVAESDFIIDKYEAKKIYFIIITYFIACHYIY
jgi:glutathione S-transferase